MIAAPATEAPQLVDTLVSNGIPLSAINPARPSSYPMSVLSDDRRAVRRLVEEMIRQGHRHIAFAEAGGHARANSGRLADYQDAFAAAGAGRLRPLIYESKPLAFTDGLTIGRELFGKTRRPTAIHCMTDYLAAGMIAASHERRIPMPHALSIAGFDSFGLATRLYPALSTATLPPMSMAVAAARQVLETLEGRDTNPLQRFACEVVLRGSNCALSSK